MRQEPYSVIEQDCLDQTLGENEEQFLSLINASPLGFILTDIKGNCTYNNPRFQAICDCAFEEGLKEGWTRFIHHEDRQSIVNEWSAYTSEGREYSGECRFQTSQHEILWVHLRSSPLRNNLGSLIGHIVMVEDITKRKQAELARWESEQQLRIAIETAKLGSWRLDIATGSIECSHTCKANFGLLPETVFSYDALVQAIHPDDRDHMRHAVKQALDQRTVYATEYRTIWPDGSIHWIIASGRGIYKDNGDPYSMAGVTFDVTERRQYEENLRRSEEWLRAIFEASRDGIIVEDEEIIIYVNSAYTLLFGYDSPDELVGKHISVVLPPEEADRMLGYGKCRVRGDIAPHIYEFKGKRKDGTLIEVEASVSTSIISGNAYITTAIRDIRARKLVEKELQKAREKLEEPVQERTAELAKANQSLQAEIRERKQAEAIREGLLRQLVIAQEEERRHLSHELHDQMGQHLTALMLGLESLKSSSDERTPEKLKHLQQIADELGSQVHHLAFELRPTALDDIGLCATLSNYLAEWSKRYNIEVDFHSVGLNGQRLPSHIETTIYRIVQESLTNVLKHAQARRISMILEYRNNHVLTIIEDDGCGFDAEGMAATSVKRQLGLLGMKERVRLAGGTVNIESTSGNGTTIFARIPISDFAGGNPL